MAENNLFKQGFSGGFQNLFDEDTFKEKQRYANFIFWIALAVEIIAAFIGLFFAWSTGYNSYVQIEDKTTSTFIYAIQGSLPFVLIAIIEPLKIPLAGGLYMVKNLGWKILIFMALMGLTLVTFETMFTSFEQNLTNINGSVIRQNNLIEKINGNLNNLTKEQKDLNNITEDGVTQKIKKQNDNLINQKQAELNTLNIQSNLALEPLQKQKNDKIIELTKLTSTTDISDIAERKNIERQINSL